jgi:CrcB protein
LDLAALGLVALGGAVGSMSRYAVQTWGAALTPGFPLGTLIVNLVGCFVIGALWPLLDRLPPAVKPLVVAGCLGGLTTMSSFAAEVMAYLQAGRLGLGMAYGLGALVACVGLAWAGSLVGGRL